MIGTALGLHVDGGAAHGVEARHVVLPVAVPHLVPETLAGRLAGDGALHEVVGCALVVEAAAVGVNAQEGLGGVEVVAVLLAADLVGGAHLLIGREQAAVERHRGGVLVHIGALAQQGQDTVAGAAGEGVHGAVAGVAGGMAIGEHLLVEGVAARGHYHALGGVHADHAVRALGIGAHYAAVLGDEVHHGSVEAHLAAVKRRDVGVHDRRHIALAGGVLAVGAVTRGEVLVEGALGHIPLQLHLHAVLGEQVGIPVDGLAGIEGPLLQKAHRHLAVGVAVHVVDDLHGVNGGLLALGLLQAAVHRAERRGAHGVAVAGLLDEQRLGAVLGGSARGEIAGGARADHEHVSVHGLHAVGVRHRRGVNEPCGLARGGREGTIGVGDPFGRGRFAGLLRRAAGHSRGGGQRAQGGRAGQKRAARKRSVGHNIPPFISPASRLPLAASRSTRTAAGSGPLP